METAVDSGSYEARLESAARILREADDILVLSHASPDGDTIGSARALGCALRRMGKRVRCACSDEIPPQYGYLPDCCTKEAFEPKLIVAVDIAAQNLFGKTYRPMADRVGLCIDHHFSNGNYAAFTLLDAHAAAACEVVADLIHTLGVEIDVDIANSIYTGLATDTGCFRYSNTRPKTLRCAAEMMERGAEFARINKTLFETSSRARLEIEREAMNTLEYFANGRAAMIYITKDMCRRAGIVDTDMEGLPSIPARIENVLVGVTVKEKESGFYKISLRTNGGVNASAICSVLGGGGHTAAAGCAFRGGLDEARQKMRELVSAALAPFEPAAGGAPNGEGTA